MTALLVRPETFLRTLRLLPFGSAVKAGEPCRGLSWGGEPESLNVGNLWPRKQRGDLRVPRDVRLRSPAHRVGGRPPPPGRGGGGVRPVAPASKPESERTSHNAAPYDPARIVQGDEGVGVRIHQRLSVVGRTVEHPSPAGGLDGGSDQRSREPRHRRARRVRCAARPGALQPRAPASSFRCRRSRPPRPAPGSAEWGPDAWSCPSRYVARGTLPKACRQLGMQQPTWQSPTDTTAPPPLRSAPPPCGSPALNRLRMTGACPAMAFSALATCSSMPRRARRARPRPCYPHEVATASSEPAPMTGHGSGLHVPWRLTERPARKLAGKCWPIRQDHQARR